MLTLKAVLAAISAILVLQTIFSFVRSRAWWVRIADFPRPQIASASLIVLGLFGWANLGSEDPQTWEWVLLALLGVSAVVQIAQMLPYTPIWRRQVPDAPPETPAEKRIRVVITNVMMKNRDFPKWRRQIVDADADVVIAVEIDKWWNDQLDELEGYPHQKRQPQDNTYGMAILSKLPLNETEIKHLVEEDIPSLFTSVSLKSGRSIKLVVVHPRPPRPDIQQDSDLRDAELVQVGKIVRTFDCPAIVAGDLNDVAWSHTTHLFQRIARMLDPRIGRGLFATFHAQHILLRYPLDHVFHSKHFDVVELRRLGDVGSDHFPVMVELALRDDDPERPEAPVSDAEDEEHAEDAVDDARERQQTESPEERRERKKQDQ